MTTLDSEVAQTAAGAALLRELVLRGGRELGGWIGGERADEAAAAPTLDEATHRLGLLTDVIGDVKFARASISAAWHAAQQHTGPADQGAPTTALSEAERDIVENITHAWGAELPINRFPTIGDRVWVRPSEAVELATRAFRAGLAAAAETVR